MARIRIFPNGVVKRVFNAKNPSIPIPWTFGEEVEVVRTIGHLDQPWLVLVLNKKETCIGLAVSVWQNYWKKNEIDIEKSLDDGETWAHINERDWGEFTNGTAVPT